MCIASLLNTTLHCTTWPQEKFLPNRSVREMVSYYYNVWKIR
jgi:hypothetical protein